MRRAPLRHGAVGKRFAFGEIGHGFEPLVGIYVFLGEKFVFLGFKSNLSHFFGKFQKKNSRKPDKWRPRRKLLTPTFHYDILKDFVEVYNRHGRTLLSKFEAQAGTGEYSDVFHTITLCTLDVICEAALGTSINAQKDPHSPYLDAVFKMKDIVFQRLLRPHYFSDTIFNLIGPGKEHDECVKVILIIKLFRNVKNGQKL